MIITSEPRVRMDVAPERLLVDEPAPFLDGCRDEAAMRIRAMLEHEGCRDELDLRALKVHVGEDPRLDRTTLLWRLHGLQGVVELLGGSNDGEVIRLDDERTDIFVHPLVSTGASRFEGAVTAGGYIGAEHYVFLGVSTTTWRRVFKIGGPRG